MAAGFHERVNRTLAPPAPAGNGLERAPGQVPTLRFSKNGTVSP